MLKTVKLIEVTKIIVQKVFEFRLFNDFWSNTMGIFVVFSALSYKDFLSSFLSLIIGGISLLTPIIIFKILHNFQNKAYDELYIESDNLDR